MTLPELPGDQRRGHDRQGGLLARVGRERWRGARSILFLAFLLTVVVLHVGLAGTCLKSSARAHVESRHVSARTGIRAHWRPERLSDSDRPSGVQRITPAAAAAALRCRSHCATRSAPHLHTCIIAHSARRHGVAHQAGVVRRPWAWGTSVWVCGAWPGTSILGHQLLLSPAEWCPIFAPWTTCRAGRRELRPGQPPRRLRAVRQGDPDEPAEAAQRTCIRARLAHWQAKRHTHVLACAHRNCPSHVGDGDGNQHRGISSCCPHRLTQRVHVQVNRLMLRSNGAEEESWAIINFAAKVRLVLTIVLRPSTCPLPRHLHLHLHLHTQRHGTPCTCLQL